MLSTRALPLALAALGSLGAACGSGPQSTSTTAATGTGNGGAPTTGTAGPATTGSGAGATTSSTSSTPSSTSTGTQGTGGTPAAGCTPATGIPYAYACWPMPNPASAGLPNPASYTVQGDGTVKDDVTGLIWQQAVTATQAYTWADAQTYC